MNPANMNKMIMVIHFENVSGEEGLNVFAAATLKNSKF